MDKHEHKECEHPMVLYCKKCDLVYCDLCDREWPAWKYSGPTWTYTNIPCTTTGMGFANTFATTEHHLHSS